MTSHQPRSDEYTALSDRMSYLLVLRIALAAVTMAWAAIRPEALGTPFIVLLGIAGAYAGVAVASEILRRSMRRGFIVMSAALILDGLFLAYAMYVTGAT